MAAIMVYADRLDRHLNLLSLARTSPYQVQALTFHAEHSQQLQQYGAEKIYCLEEPSSLPAASSATVAALLKQEEVSFFLVGSTVLGRELAAQVAEHWGAHLISHAISCRFTDQSVITNRLIYGGALVQEETSTSGTVITLPYGLTETVSQPAAGELIILPGLPDPRMEILEASPLPPENKALSEADKVVGVGLGMTQQEDLTIVQALASALGAELGCTRSIAEELHWMPLSSYIGISGAVISPSLYIAMGISGQIQHMIGVQDAKLIVAINNDENAPIFSSSDYGLVGDMYEIIPLLTAALKKT